MNGIVKVGIHPSAFTRIGRASERILQVRSGVIRPLADAFKNPAFVEGLYNITQKKATAGPKPYDDNSRLGPGPADCPGWVANIVAGRTWTWNLELTRKTKEEFISLFKEQISLKLTGDELEFAGGIFDAFLASEKLNVSIDQHGGEFGAEELKLSKGKLGKLVIAQLGLTNLVKRDLEPLLVND